MSTFLSPGVYFKEVPTARPILGVGTSTAAFIGAVAATVTMPIKADGTPYTLIGAAVPTLVTSFEGFTRGFGVPGAGNQTLAQAVYGFFENGGTTCYVTRVGDVTSDTAIQSALDRIAAIDEVAIVAAPGALKKSVQQKLIAHCELLEDRFAILDGQRVLTNLSEDAITDSLPPSQYAALYYPWIQVSDLVPDAPPRIVPSSGHVAGIYSRVDQARGVHKAPGNEQVRGALDVEYQVARGEQDVLNPRGVNVIRNFRGDIRVWGARTLGGQDSPILYLNVRRTLTFIRESIDEGTQWAVFEPNAKPLWEQLKRAVSAFLTNVWRDGALFGDTPEQAFFVRCDEALNPPEVRDAGQVIVEIGVAIVRPAEFVVFRISQLAGIPA
jgi:phage tail sheath protein FI